MNSGYISLVSAQGEAKKMLIRVDSIDLVMEYSDDMTGIQIGSDFYYVKGGFDQIRTTVTQAGQLSRVMG